VDCSSGRVMALKAVRQQDENAAQEEASKHQRAVERARPECVPKFYFCDWGDAVSGSASDEERRRLLGIAMEHIDGCSLGALLRKKEDGVLGSPQVYAVIKDVFVALTRLHEHGIVHCDVKSDNVMVSRQGQCYLCDFGEATFLEDHDDEAHSMPVAGTPSHMAPELFRTNPVRFDCKLDVWAAGILGFEMAVGRTPWHHEADGYLPNTSYIFDMLKVIESVDLSKVPIKGLYVRMLEECLRVDPEDRIPAKDVIQDTQFLKVHEGYREMLGELV